MTDKEIIQLLMLIVQTLTLGGLIWYANETRKIREAAQKEVQASNDQAEGLSKPCLTFVGALRDGTDTILEMHGAAGNFIAGEEAGTGKFMIVNIGSGVALNIRYQFTRPEHTPDVRYIPNLQASTRAALVEPVAAYNTEHRVTFDYESLGGRKYRTTIELNHRVMTSFHFEEVKQQT